MVDKNRGEKGYKLDLSSSEEFEKFSHLIDQLRKKHGITVEDLLALTSNKDSIPISIFQNDLSPLECVTKYMRENAEMSNKEIGKILNRSPKTIWQAYKFSLEKIPDNLEIKDSSYFVPYNLLGNRKFSILENVVKFLVEEQNLKFSQIADLINRDDRTIWTVYDRVQKKVKNES